MKCPTCGDKIKNSICDACGYDFNIDGKIENMAITAYNKGLEKANEKNISKAIEYLEKAVSINKKFTEGRNLLGLCYFETGKLGEAIAEWVISSSFNKEDNQAKRYVEYVQNDVRNTEKMNEAISLYNESLAFLSKGSADLATMRLRKAMESSPNFIEAKNLLALCYLEEGRNDDARELFNKVLSIDIGNEKALYFLQLIDGAPIQKKQTTATPTKRVVPAPPPNFQEGVGKQRSLTLKDIFVFLLGAVLSLAIIYYMVVPDVISKKDKEITQLADDMETMQKQKDNEVRALQEEINKKDLAYEELETTVATLETELHIKNQEQLAFFALDYVRQQEYQQAADIVLGLEIDTLSFEAKETALAVLEEALPILEKDFYLQGMTEYNAGNNDEAEKRFLHTLLYMATPTTYGDDAYYYLGRIAEKRGDDDAAQKYYKTVIGEFPDSNQSKEANKRIKE